MALKKTIVGTFLACMLFAASLPGAGNASVRLSRVSANTRVAAAHKLFVSVEFPQMGGPYIYVLDPASGKVVGSISNSGLANASAGLALANGKLYATNWETGQIFMFDADSLAYLGLFATTAAQNEPGEACAGDGNFFLPYDYGNHVAVIGLASGRHLGPFETGKNSGPNECAYSNGKLFVSDNYTINVYDVKTRQLSATVANDCYGVDVVNGKIFVSCPTQGDYYDIKIFSESTYALLSTIPSNAQYLVPGIAVGGGVVYVPTSNSKIAAYSIQTGQPLSGFTYPSTDQPFQLLYY